MTTTWEQFHQAALALVGAGTVKQRLATAYRQYLNEIDVETLPRDMRGDFQTLARSLTSERAIGGLGTVEATVRKMSDQEASRCAARIVEMYAQLSDTQAPAARPHGLRAISGQG